MEKLYLSYIPGVNVKCAATVENTPAVPQKVIVFIQPSDSTPRHMPKRTENLCSHKNLYISVPRSLIHSSQNVGTTQMSIE